MSANTICLIIFWILSSGACVWFYFFKKRIDNDFEQLDCVSDSDSLESAQIIGEFRAYLKDIKIRMLNNEISAEKARELVLKKQAKAYRKIQTGRIRNALKGIRKE